MLLSLVWTSHYGYKHRAYKLICGASRIGCVFWNFLEVYLYLSMACIDIIRGSTPQDLEYHVSLRRWQRDDMILRTTAT